MDCVRLHGAVRQMENLTDVVRGEQTAAPSELFGGRKPRMMHRTECDVSDECVRASVVRVPSEVSAIICFRVARPSHQHERPVCRAFQRAIGRRVSF